MELLFILIIQQDGSCLSITKVGGGVTDTIQKRF
jgi:hypothetical protein